MFAPAGKGRSGFPGTLVGQVLGFVGGIGRVHLDQYFT
jgi:hypothetical protein